MADALEEPIVDPKATPSEMLAELVQRVEAPIILNDSLFNLLDGLCDLLASGHDPAELVDAMRAPAAFDDPDTRSIRVRLKDALTANTSHVAVHKQDPLIDVLRSSLEMPAKDKAAHVASIKLFIEQPELDRAAHIDSLQTQIDGHAAEKAELDAAAAALQAQVDTHAGTIATQAAQLAAIAPRVEVLERQLADKSAQHDQATNLLGQAGAVADNCSRSLTAATEQLAALSAAAALTRADADAKAARIRELEEQLKQVSDETVQTSRNAAAAIAETQTACTARVAELAKQLREATSQLQLADDEIRQMRAQRKPATKG